MARHRDEEGRRGISRGPVIAVASVVVLILAILGWFQLRDRISDQGIAAARTCVEGETVLDVAADPDISAPVRAIAERYNETSPVVRDHCVTVTVTDAASEEVGAALADSGDGQWSGPGPAPALWIPQSSVSLARLVDTPGVVNGTPKAVAHSPVVLAVPNPLRDGLTKDRIDWQDLAGLQSDPGSLPVMGLPGWGGLGLALPPASDTTALAGQAVTAAVTGAGTGPVTVEGAQSDAATAALTSLARDSRALGELPTASDALNALAAQSKSSAEKLHAVPVTEVQLALLGDDKLSGYTPGGAAPVADHPAVVLGTGWVDETRSRAAAQFAEFVRAPEQAEILTEAGFTSESPAGSLAQADPAAANAVLAPLGATTGPRAATVLLDVSASMSRQDGNGTRLDNVATALTERLAVLPDDSEVGLWLYSRGLSGSRPYRIAVETGPLSATRDDIEQALASATPASATSTYPSLITAYDAAVAGYVPGRTNSIVLVTDGPNDDTSMTSADFLRTITAASSPDRPVQVDVIAVGENSDAATLTRLAELTGGTMTTVPNSSGPEFGAALTRLLG